MKRCYTLPLPFLTVILLYTASCSYNNRMDHIKKTSPKNHIRSSMYMENPEKNAFEEDFEQAIAAYKAKNNGKILNISKGKDIVVVFGNTGAGKSTLLNLLVGHDMKKKDAGYEVVKKNGMDMFHVGHSDKSQTLFPQCVEAKNGILYVDLPGLNDTRGEGTAFVNAVCIKDILIQAKSVKFLFVETQGAFETQRGEAFKYLLKTIFNLLPYNRDQLSNSSLFIVTKADKIQHKIIYKDYILGKAPAELFQIFPNDLLKTERLVPFVKPNFFTEPNYDSDASDDEDKFNADKLATHQNELKVKIEKKIKQLEPILIQKIDITKLLKSGTFNKLEKFCENKMNSWVKKYFAKKNIKKYNKNSLNKLEDLQDKIHHETEEEFTNFLSKNPIWNFVKTYDKKLYKDILQKITIKLEKELQIFKEKIQNQYQRIQNEIQLEQADKNHKEICDNMKKEHQKALENMKNENKAERELMKKNFEEKLKNQNASHDSYVKELKAEIASDKKEFEERIKKIDNHWLNSPITKGLLNIGTSLGKAYLKNKFIDSNRSLHYSPYSSHYFQDNFIRRNSLYYDSSYYPSKSFSQEMDTLQEVKDDKKKKKNK